MAHRILVTLAALIAFAGAARADGPEIAALVSERLSLMQDVAAWKLENDRPVEDLDREAVVLDQATERAAARGIDAGGVRVFFRRQIEAAKEIQRCWLARWHETPPDTAAPDLVTEIRPELLRIGERIVDTIARELRDGAQLSVAAGELRIDCLSLQTARHLSAALSGLRPADR